MIFLINLFVEPYNVLVFSARRYSDHFFLESPYSFNIPQCSGFDHKLNSFLSNGLFNCMFLEEAKSSRFSRGVTPDPNPADPADTKEKKKKKKGNNP